MIVCIRLYKKENVEKFLPWMICLLLKGCKMSLNLAKSGCPLYKTMPILYAIFITLKDFQYFTTVCTSFEYYCSAPTCGIMQKLSNA